LGGVLVSTDSGIRALQNRGRKNSTKETFFILSIWKSLTKR
jgi:hypothetical protein